MNTLHNLKGGLFDMLLPLAFSTADRPHIGDIIAETAAGLSRQGRI